MKKLSTFLLALSGVLVTASEEAKTATDSGKPGSCGSIAAAASDYFSRQDHPADAVISSYATPVYFEPDGTRYVTVVLTRQPIQQVGPIVQLYSYTVVPLPGGEACLVTFPRNRERPH